VSLSNQKKEDRISENASTTYLGNGKSRTALEFLSLSEFYMLLVCHQFYDWRMSHEGSQLDTVYMTDCTHLIHNSTRLNTLIETYQTSSLCYAAQIAMT